VSQIIWTFVEQSICNGANTIDDVIWLSFQNGKIVEEASGHY